MNKPGDIPGKVHVERVVMWNVVIKRPDGSFKLWLHDSQEEAVERADRMFRVGLFTERGEDNL